MTGLLVYREILLPHANTVAGKAPSDAPQDVWLGIYLGEEERVGFLHFETHPVLRNEGAGIGMRVTASLKMDLLSLPTELNINGHAWRLNAGGLADFDFTLRSGKHEMVVEGDVSDGMLHSRLHVGDDVTPFTLPVDDTLFFSGGMGMTALDLPSLEPGQEVYIDSFDPMTMSVGKAKVRCVGIDPMDFRGETVDAYALETTVAGITTKAWVTEDDQMIRAETAFGFIIKQITPDEALAPVNPGQASNLIRSLAVIPTGKTPQRNASLMRVKVTGLPEDQLPPSEPTQQAEGGGVYTLRMPTEPASGATTAGLENVDDFLGADPIIATDNPKILAVAKEAIGDASTPWAKSRAIYAWVYENIDKISVISVPTALDVLRTRQGDCNEHTILFTAMARSVDIPTRVAIGLVYSEAISGFGYHAWPEVYVGGAWVPMDPTLGQPLADATHIKLLNGSIGKWAQLVRFIGQIEVEVLEVQ